MSSKVTSRTKATRKKSGTKNRGRRSGAGPPRGEETANPPAAATAAAPDAQTTPESVYDFADTLQDREASGAGNGDRVERSETFVTFHLAGELYGLPVTEVREILRVSTITHVPHAPACVRGITNVRGHVLPVFDCRERLGLAPTDPGAHSRILVVSPGNRMVGLLVDAAHKVLSINRDAVQEPPSDVVTDRSDYIVGIYRQQDQLFILLDLHRVLMLGERAAPDSTRV